VRDSHGYYNHPDGYFDESKLKEWWNSRSSFIGKHLVKLLISELTTRSRLADCDPPQAVDAREPWSAVHPFHRMFEDDALEATTSDAFRIAFKSDFIIYRGAGKYIPAYVGQRPSMKEGEDRVSRGYLDRLRCLQPLEVQGDGIRSFISVVGRVLTENRPIQLIDEPEAFLHPPQAKLIAQLISKYSRDKQTFLATHSSDVLQGLLRENSGRVSIVRLSRSATSARANYLPTESVAALWNNPILQFSNILDGLFHEGVIVTEADADCRFYEALSKVTIAQDDLPDTHYTYSGGKDRMPVVIAALVGLKVPVASIVDFDVLNAEQPLRRIVEAHGGAWQSVKSDWSAVKAAVESKEAFLGGDTFRQEISKLLAQIGNGVAVPKPILNQIKQLVRSASPWDNVKESGLSCISPGAPTVAAKKLLRTLQTMGIFVAPQGQMEGFCRSIGGHGPRWVEEVMKRDLRADPELDAARTFVESVLSYLKRV
jgi:hypothetical protein